MERGGFLRKERRKGHFALGATRSKMAILLWAQPVASSQSKEAATEAGKTEAEAKEDYFPVCHVFAACQVQPMKSN